MSVKVGTKLREYLAILAIGLLLAEPVGAAPRTDVVVLLNGDRLTGEVKELEHGKLKLKTDNMDTLYVQWDKVANLQSTQRLEVELANGVRYFGSAEATTESRRLLLKDHADSVPVDLAIVDVLAIYPIDQGRRLAILDGYLTAGYSFKKANSLQDFVFTGGLSTTQEKRQWSLDASAAVTTQNGSNDTQRFDVTGQHRRFLPNQLFWQGTLEFESNDELGLALRTSLGGAIGRYLKQTSHQEWSAYAGVNLTSEHDTGEENQRNIEGLLGTQYALYHYDSPERTLSAEANVLPSLTQSGRVRLGAKVRLRFEIVKDFFFEISMYGIHDNKPGVDAASNSDYGTETSLGYSF